MTRRRRITRLRPSEGGAMREVRPPDDVVAAIRSTPPRKREAVPLPETWTTALKIADLIQSKGDSIGWFGVASAIKSKYHLSIDGDNSRVRLIDVKAWPDVLRAVVEEIAEKHGWGFEQTSTDGFLIPPLETNREERMERIHREGHRPEDFDGLDGPEVDIGPQIEAWSPLVFAAQMAYRVQRMARDVGMGRCVIAVPKGTTVTLRHSEAWPPRLRRALTQLAQQYDWVFLYSNGLVESMQGPTPSRRVIHRVMFRDGSEGSSMSVLKPWI